ncbi:MAG: PQQ-binding-like beta-propeller repeat protein [Pirellulaceae bacterium]
MSHPATEGNAGDLQAPGDNQEKAAKKRKLSPPVWVLVFVGLIFVAVAWIRFGYVTGDHAGANLLTLVGCFLAFVIIAAWFFLLSGYRLLTRVLVFAGGMAALMGAKALFTVDHVSGELVPTFKLRWAPSPDELLAVPVADASRETVDLVTTTDNDFPQFLGPHRDLRVDGFTLNRDWRANPPRLLWRQPIGAGWSSFAVVSGFAVTMEQRGELELVTCYQVQTGKPVWTHGVTTRHRTTMGGVGPRCTPTIHGGKVYSLGATGAFHCLDGASGTVIWQEDLLKRCGVTPAEDATAVGWGRSNSPLIVDDMVVVPVGGAKGGPYVSLVAFDKDTGELVWEAGDRQVSYSSPVLATLCGKRQILSVNEDSISGYDPNTGETLWSQDWPGNSATKASVSQPAILGNDRFLLTKGYGAGSAMFRIEAVADDFRVKEVWRETRLLKTKFTNVVVYQGYVFGLSDGILECVDLSSGERQWKRGRYGHGQLLGVGDLLLVQAESGEVALVEARPDRLEELGSFVALDGKTWNNLCLYGRFLLVRNGEEAACYELAIEDARLNRT